MKNSERIWKIVFLGLILGSTVSFADNSDDVKTTGQQPGFCANCYATNENYRKDWDAAHAGGDVKTPDKAADSAGTGEPKEP